MPRFAAILAAALLLLPWPGGGSSRAQTPAPSASGSPAWTGRASVRLIRLLSEVPEEVEGKAGPLHDVRVQLVRGNVLVFRKGGEFAALLPIDRVPGGDSLRYFYYVEKATVFWFFAGERTRGILTVPAGGNMTFDSFRLVWGEGEGLGYVYFPETSENVGLRFSVVSGQSVDTADPKDTKYWVELGAGDKAGS